MSFFLKCKYFSFRAAQVDTGLQAGILFYHPARETKTFALSSNRILLENLEVNQNILTLLHLQELRFWESED